MINKKFWKKKKVLITGHTGFKGGWLSLILSYLNCNVYGYALAPVGINNFFNNTDNWWNNEKTNKVKNEFCLKYSDQNFNTQLFVNELNKL